MIVITDGFGSNTDIYCNVKITRFHHVVLILCQNCSHSDCGLFDFQCEFPFVRRGDELLHIFSHHISKTEDDLRELLRSFMLGHLDWINQISEILLTEVNVSVEDYIDSITSLGVPLDFVAIVALCRMYHIHLAVYTAKGMWSMSRQHHIKNCLFGVLFRGGFEFSEVIKEGCNAEYTRWLAMRREQGKLPSHERTALPSEVKMEQKVCTVQEALAVVNNACICPHGRVKFCHHCTKDLKPLVKPETVPETVTNDIKVEQEETQPTVHVSDLDSGSETEPAQDNTIDALWRVAESSVIEAKAAFGETVANTNENENLDFEVEAPHELLLQCPVCHYMETTQKACVKHISEKHPAYRFQCLKCDGTFPSFSTKYRHEKEHHEQPKHFCAECGMGFVYNSELLRHIGKHNEVLPFSCDKCEKRFAQEKSLKRHKNVHSEQSLQCKGCDRVFTTPERLYSHYRGAHGKGYDALCGKNFPWPAGRARHQDECDKCKELKKQKDRAKKRRFSDTSRQTTVKDEDNSDDETIQDTKARISMKIENILQIKKDVQ